MEERSTKSSLSGFVYYLSEKQLLDRKVAVEAVQQAKNTDLPYVDYLVKQRLVDAALLAKAISEYYGLPLCDIKAFNPKLIPEEFLNIPLVRKGSMLPLFVKNDFLYLAVTDPTIENLNDIRFLTGLEYKLLIVDSNQLALAIDNVLNRLIISEISSERGKKGETITIDAYQDESTEIAAYDVESAPVVNYLNKIMYDAIEQKASDIHFERYERDYRIRYRINGALYPIAAPPTKLANYVLARIKILSTLDITEHRIPQDGRFKLNFSKSKTMDVRVSVCPTLFGEKIVLRLLDPAQLFHGIDELGMQPVQKDQLLLALSATQGMILVTGPTGSGKTVTLYSALNYLNSTEDNIMTVEDPVEIPLQGINQVHVNAKVGLTFSTALRSFLRQDPDIIMVGEIRDLETAEIAVKAAQTGHLVLSTLHTNNAPATVTRLMNMGIESYNLASSLVLIIAQRLLRVLCKYCKQEEILPNDILIKEGFKKEDIGTFKLYKASSCDRCSHGYSGRTGIFEVMPITEEMSYLIMRGAGAKEIAELAKKENTLSLRDAGLSKVKEGLISLAELNRTFK